MHINQRISRPKHVIRPLRVGSCALFLALICLLVSPLTAAACGGLFSADAYTEQGAERLIFAVDPGKVTLYEQIHYTGSPQDFAWVLPVPAVPTVSTTSISLFQSLDEETAPDFYQESAPSCGSNGMTTAPAPAPGAVNVYSSGAVGPYNYNVIGSSDPQAVTTWLTAHKYKIPAASQTEMQPYIAAHMLFLALQLRGNTSTQDMLPVKISYASSQSTVTIPLRMATPMSKENLGVLVWIFAQNRYVPQNYASLQLNYNQLEDNLYSKTAYPSLVSSAVSKASGGHGFVTEYAQPTSNLYGDDPEITSLVRSHSYLTRLYTSIAPAQINLDPSFVAAPGQPNVSRYHEIANPASAQPPACPPSATIIAGIGGGIVVVVLAVILLVVIRRRRTRRG